MNDAVDSLDGFVVCARCLNVGNNNARYLSFVLRESFRDEVNMLLGADASEE